MDTQEEKVCTHLAVMQWSAVCSGLSYLEQLPLHGQEQGINYYLRDVCKDTRKSNECRLTLLQRGLFKCLENHPLPIFICFFAISLCSGLLNQRYDEAGPLVEFGLQGLSAVLSLSICRGILNIFVNF